MCGETELASLIFTHILLNKPLLKISEKKLFTVTIIIYDFSLQVRVIHSMVTYSKMVTCGLVQMDSPQMSRGQIAVSCVTSLSYLACL